MASKKTKTKVKDLSTKKNPKGGGSVTPPGGVKGSKIQTTDTW